MRIYFVLLRFGALSFMTAVLDNIVFSLLFLSTGGILTSQIGARAVAVLFNYGAARKAVFLSNQAHRTVFPKYLMLVALSGAASYGLIHLFTAFLPVPVIWAKLMAELLLFAINFVVQRDLIFTRRKAAAAATDWDTYYMSVPLTAKLTRRYTTATLIAALKEKAGMQANGSGVLVEIGGANSCFLDALWREVQPGRYHVIDNNAYGLELLKRRLAPGQDVRLHGENILEASLDLQADVVFSVGLIEHFDTSGTREVIRKHFTLLRPGGYAIISFPTPTWLYRVARAITESVGLWKFPDERPLRRDEVLNCVSESGEVLFEKTLWQLVFTQHMVVVRKSEQGRLAAAPA
jgi:putative flippase GtrA/SAM-dependent methyltransferase